MAGRLVSPLASSSAVAAVMRANRKRDTRPELFVRHVLYALGYRYRLHGKDIPGCPDIVFRKQRKVIFVHGCFWHQHENSRCFLQSHPKSNLSYWRPKLRQNRQRDKMNARKIADLGWKALVVWECELEDASLKSKLIAFLGAPQS